MTFEEALIEKQKAKQEDPNITLIIAPALPEEYEKFINNYDEETYSDQDCKAFSTNQDYIIALVYP